MLAWKSMVRLLTLSGLILLLAAPTASAGVREKILRECQEGRITGDYTPGAAPRRPQEHPDRHRRVLRLP